MPTPEGIITTSEIYVTEPLVEEVKKDLGIEIEMEK